MHILGNAKLNGELNLSMQILGPLGWNGALNLPMNTFWTDWAGTECSTCECIF
jgi:hypothetical protein